MRGPSSVYSKLARKVTSTTLAVLLLTGFAALIAPAPMNIENNADAQLMTDLSFNAPVPATSDSLKLRPGLPFVLNEGQVHSDVRFYVDTLAGRVYVTDSGLTYDHIVGASLIGMATKESFIHANPVQPFGTEHNQAVVNYFVGEESNWRAGVATFDQVSFGEVWDGIVIDLRSENNNIEKIFTVSPGAEADDILIRVDGVKELRHDESGELVFETELGPVSLTAPVAYQEINGDLRAVQVSYLIKDTDQYGFALGSDYNPNYSLIIDPLFASTFVGGSADDGRSDIDNNDSAGDIAIDSSGNVFLAGITLSSDYPTTAGAYDPSDPGVIVDAFVSKFDSNLSTLLGSTYLGGSAYDEAFGIAVDSSDNVFVVGKTNSSNFPLGPSPFDSTDNGGKDIFVSRLDNNLATLDASTYIGGTGDDEARDITIDSSDSVYFVGWTDSSDYPIVGGIQGDTGGRDVIVTRMNVTLGVLASTYIGGGTIDEGHAIAMNSTDTGVLVTGRTTSANYPTTAGAFDTSSNGASDAFVSLLNPDLGALTASTFVGGSTFDVANGVVAMPAPSLEVYIAGRTNSADFPINATSGFDLSHNGDYDAFVARLAPHLDSLASSTFIGGANVDFANDISVVPSGGIYVAVQAGPGYPTTSGAYDESHNGNNEAAVSSLSADLSSLTASTFLGGTEVEGPTSLAHNSGGDVYLAGITNSADFPVTGGAYDSTQNGNFDMFVSRLSGDLAASVQTISFDSDFYGTADTATITVTDAAADISPAADSVMVNVFSTTDPVGLDLSATETGASTGIFVTTVDLTTGSAANLLTVSAGDIITADYSSVQDTATVVGDLGFAIGEAATLVIGQSDFTSSGGPDPPNASSFGDVPGLPGLGVTGAAFDSSGNLWIADTLNNRVLKFNAPFANGQAASLVLGQSIFTTNAAPNPPTASSLNAPSFLMFDSLGSLWVADENNRRVLRYDAPFSTGQAASLVLGASSFTSVTPATPTGPTNVTPRGLAFDSSGDLWVADFGASRVLRFDAPFSNNQAASLVIGQPDFTSNGFLAPLTASKLTPIGLAFDSSGTLWASDQIGGRVLAFTPPFSNNQAASVVIGKPDFSTQQGGCTAINASCTRVIRGVAVDAADNLWIAEHGSNRVLGFAAPIVSSESASVVLGQPDFTSIAESPASATSLLNPSGVILDQSGNLWVTDTENERVLRYGSAVSFVPTNLFLDPIHDVTATTGFTVSGNLSTNTGEPITGQLITFTGTGVTPSLQAVTTDGVDFVGDINLVSCPTPAVPGSGDCVPDELATPDTNSADNIVLHLGVGGKIIFPEGTMGTKLWIQNMGDTSFKYIVEEGNNVLQPEAVSGGSTAVIPIVQIISGFSTVGGDFVPNGLKEITITEVGGSTVSGSVGIAAVLTTNPDGFPAEQHQINFEEFAAGPKSSPFTVNAGHFFAVGFAQNVESIAPLGVIAHFAGTALYDGDDSGIEFYDVIVNTAGTQGEGGDPASSTLGGSITTATCIADNDQDGICKSWEENGVIPGGDVPGVSSAVSYVLPPGDGNRADDDSRRDIYVEIDCMLQATSGNYCPSASDLTAVTTAFSGENIRLTISLSDQNIPFKNPFHIWTANDGDADMRNDFENVKKDLFGTSTERSQGAAGTLRSGKDLLEIKAQIFHYGVFVDNLNTGVNQGCGPSGQAELRGNDFVVSLGCNFTGAKGSAQEIQGTLMHEIGHNLGLEHGGFDSDNCKPNHISVMSYSRQMPWANLPATNSDNNGDAVLDTVNWALTFSREDLDGLNGPLDETAVIEDNGLRVTSGQWSGTLPAGYQFKMIWGQPPSVRTGVTGATVNWDKDGNSAESVAYSQDLNKIAGVLGCNPGSTVLTAFQSYDEFANLDLKFRDGANMDGLVYPDPDTLSELTFEVFEGVSSSSLTIEPIANVLPGEQITATGILTDSSDNPLANELVTFSGSGAENLASDTTDADGRYTSSGSAPATVGTGWEVEAHFEGTASNGPANSNVETYDTLSGDTSPPTVTSTEPANAATDVAISAIVNASFSEQMNDGTITDLTFTLEDPSGAIGGTVTYDSVDDIASFDPVSDLAYATTYTATISGTVEDSAGNPMGTDYTWTFTTQPVPLTVTGFYAPVDMEDANGNPIVNSIKSGRAVALKFEVFDSSNVEQTDTSVVLSFMQKKINCATLQGEPVDPVETTNTGGTDLRYDTDNGFFVQNWKTPGGQKGSCYKVTLTVVGGSSITAFFKLT